VNAPRKQATAALTATALLLVIGATADAAELSAAKPCPLPKRPPGTVSEPGQALRRTGRCVPQERERIRTVGIPPYTDGSTGLGDPYFPSAGNGGYDAKNYDVTLAYRSPDKHIDAVVKMTATATQALSGFSLDLRGLRVRSVLVDGLPAVFRRERQELMVTPATPLPRGRSFTTVVRYSGRPGPLSGPMLGTYGWIPTQDGILTLSEPDGTPTWMPVNDHPRDKATYTFRVTVPNWLQVIANGEPRPPVRGAATTTYTWVERSPMASYLAMIAIGRFRTLRGRAGSLPVITAVDPQYAGAAGKLHRTTIAVLNWQRSLFGRYPFATGGGVIDDPDVGYALETQERPVYAGFVPDTDFIVHELAHQWFGNSVSLTAWPDIWLNEGFATYAEWLWQEHRTAKAKKGRRDTAKKIFTRYYRQPADSPIFQPPPGQPGRRDLFGFSVYIRGAMCLQALRQRIGDRAFFRTLRAWIAERRHGNGRTADFVALAERQSGRQLDRLFHAWLYAKGKPRDW
jgi:aminopeptidase N